MKELAIIADIHGNAVALDAVLSRVARDNCDVICLGDAIQGGPEPRRVVSRLRELSCPVVMGNADAWVLTGKVTSGAESITDRQEAVREWTFGQLSEGDRHFMEGFVPVVELPLGPHGTLLAFHGSPTSFDALIFPETPDTEVKAMMAGHGAAVFTGGHTHIQQIRRLGRSLFVNPGSVGLVHEWVKDSEPRFDAWAEYAVLSFSDGGLSVDFRRQPYDVELAMAAALESGMPDASALAACYRAEPEQV